MTGDSLLQPSDPTQIQQSAEPIQPPPPITRPLGTFYAIDYSKGSFQEFLFPIPAWQKPLMAIIAFFIKLFGIQVAGSTDDAPIESWAPFELHPAGFPEESRHRLAADTAALQQEGFTDPIYHYIVDELHDTTYATATLTHSSGRAIARVVDRRWYEFPVPKQFIYIEIITPLADNTWLVTTTAKPDSLWPESVRLDRVITGTANAVWTSHQERLAKVAIPANAVNSSADARRVLEACHAALRDFHLKRGVFRVLDAHDNQRLHVARKSHDLFINDPFFNRCVYASANKQATTRKQSWTAFLLMLGITGALFVAGFKAIAHQATWEDILFIVVILLFHEAGHYLAMKAFGYKDLKMFFIPMLGAAVMGRADKVAGWKQVVTYLAGPVPGILLAIPLTIVIVVTGNQLLFQFTLLLLILNAFNLLPIIPFDGGHVVHRTLFIRHPVFELVFRIIGGIALVLLGFCPGFFVLTILGVILLISTPASFKTAQYIHNIRHSMRDDEPDAGVPIGPVHARPVIEYAIQAGQGKQSKAKVVATAVPILDSIHSTPPGPVSSAFFLAIQVGAVAAAVILGSVAGLAANPNLRAQIASIASLGLPPESYTTVPRRAPDPIQAVTQNTPQTDIHSGYAPSSKADYYLVAASFPDEAAARENFEWLKTKTPSGSAHLLLGNGILANVNDPTATKAIKLRDELLIKTPAAFFSGKSEWVEFDEDGVIIRFQAKALSAKDAARQAELLNTHLKHDFNQSRLLTPWQPGDTRSAEEKAKHERARKTFALIRQTLNDRQAEDTELKRIGTEQSKVLRGRTNSADFKKWSDAYQKRIDEIKDQILAELRSNPNADQDLLAAYALDEKDLQLPHGQRPDEWMPRCTKLMGRVPEADHQTAKFTSSQGAARHEGDQLIVDIGFIDPVHGAPAFFDYLKAKGFTDIRAGIYQGYPHELDTPQTQPTTTSPNS